MDGKKLLFNADEAEEYFTMLCTSYRDTANDIFRRDNEGRHASEQIYSAEYQKYLGMQIAMREVLEYFSKFELVDHALRDQQTIHVTDLYDEDGGEVYQAKRDVPDIFVWKKSLWISVKDRLPERTMPPHDVLVYHDLNCGMCIDRAWYSYEKNKWRNVLGMNLKVTHWMPLPEPPEDDHV